MSADPPTGDRARPGFREVSIGADGVERAPNPMSEPPQSDPLPDGEAPGSRERSGDDDFMVGVVRWLERTGLFWPAAVTLAVFVLAGADAYVREKPGEGLAFAAIAVLVLVSRSRTLPAYQAAETFLGTSSLAVLVVVHITLLGPEPAALLLSFVAFVAARRWIERDPFGPTCLYLAVDVVVVGTEIDAQVDAWLASAGNALFSWPGFYWGLMFIPALYAHLKLDDWGRARFERPALRDDFGFVSAAAAVLILAPPAALLEDSSAWIAIAALFVPAVCVFFVGLLATTGGEGKGRLTRRFVFLALFLTEMTVVTAIRDGFPLPPAP